MATIEEELNERKRVAESLLQTRRAVARVISEGLLDEDGSKGQAAFFEGVVVSLHNEIHQQRNSLQKQIDDYKASIVRCEAQRDGLSQQASILTALLNSYADLAKKSREELEKRAEEKVVAPTPVARPATPPPPPSAEEGDEEAWNEDEGESGDDEEEKEKPPSDEPPPPRVPVMLAGGTSPKPQRGRKRG